MATLTRNIDQAGTDSPVFLVITRRSMNSIILEMPRAHQVNQRKAFQRGHANVFQFELSAADNLDLETNVDLAVNVFNTGNDEWMPEHIIVWGQEANAVPLQRKVVAIAMATGIGTGISAQSGEGVPSLPIPLVETGGDSSEISRLLLLMTTSGGTIAGTSAEFHGTDSPIELQIATREALVVSHDIPDTPQPDQEHGQANLYFAPVAVPFAKSGLTSRGITLQIKGDDEWIPFSLFLFGLDDTAGNPSRLTPMVHLPDWPFGFMSTDSNIGLASVTLPVFRSSLTSMDVGGDVTGGFQG